MAVSVVMARTWSWSKRRCGICGVAYSPTALHWIDERHQRLCVHCLNGIWRHQETWSVPAGEAASPARPEITEEERNELAQSVRQFFTAARLWGAVRDFFRIGFYVTTFFITDPAMGLYPLMQGAVYADLVTWLMFSSFELPFRGMAFAIDFALYGGLVSVYFAQRDMEIVVPVDPEQFAVLSMAFLGVMIVKIAWWVAKVFVLEED